jgi:hypothetical protein
MVGHVGWMVEMRNVYNILVKKNLNRSEDLGADGNIILKWMLGKWGGRV